MHRQRAPPKGGGEGGLSSIWRPPKYPGHRHVVLNKGGLYPIWRSPKHPGPRHVVLNKGGLYPIWRSPKYPGPRHVVLNKGGLYPIWRSPKHPGPRHVVLNKGGLYPIWRSPKHPGPRHVVLNKGACILSGAHQSIQDPDVARESIPALLRMLVQEARGQLGQLGVRDLSCLLQACDEVSSYPEASILHMLAKAVLEVKGSRGKERGAPMGPDASSGTDQASADSIHVAFNAVQSIVESRVDPVQHAKPPADRAWVFNLWSKGMESNVFAGCSKAWGNKVDPGGNSAGPSPPADMSKGVFSCLYQAGGGKQGEPVGTARTTSADRSQGGGMRGIKAWFGNQGEPGVNKAQTHSAATLSNGFMACIKQGLGESRRARGGDRPDQACLRTYQGGVVNAGYQSLVGIKGRPGWIRTDQPPADLILLGACWYQAWGLHACIKQVGNQGSPGGTAQDKPPADRSQGGGRRYQQGWKQETRVTGTETLPPEEHAQLRHYINYALLSLVTGGEPRAAASSGKPGWLRPWLDITHHAASKKEKEAASKIARSLCSVGALDNSGPLMAAVLGLTPHDLDPSITRAKILLHQIQDTRTLQQLSSLLGVTVRANNSKVAKTAAHFKKRTSYSRQGSTEVENRTTPSSSGAAEVHVDRTAPPFRSQQGLEASQSWLDSGTTDMAGVPPTSSHQGHEIYQPQLDSGPTDTAGVPPTSSHQGHEISQPQLVSSPIAILRLEATRLKHAAWKSQQQLTNGSPSLPPSPSPSQSPSPSASSSPSPSESSYSSSLLPRLVLGPAALQAAHLFKITRGTKGIEGSASVVAFTNTCTILSLIHTNLALAMDLRLDHQSPPSTHSSPTFGTVNHAQNNRRWQPIHLLPVLNALNQVLKASLAVGYVPNATLLQTHVQGLLHLALRHPAPSWGDDLEEKDRLVSAIVVQLASVARLSARSQHGSPPLAQGLSGPSHLGYALGRDGGDHHASRELTYPAGPASTTNGGASCPWVFLWPLLAKAAPTMESEHVAETAASLQQLYNQAQLLHPASLTPEVESARKDAMSSIVHLFVSTLSTPNTTEALQPHSNRTTNTYSANISSTRSSAAGYTEGHTSPPSSSTLTPHSITDKARYNDHMREVLRSKGYGGRVGPKEDGLDGRQCSELSRQNMSWDDAALITWSASKARVAAPVLDRLQLLVYKFGLEDPSGLQQPHAPHRRPADRPALTATGFAALVASYQSHVAKSCTEQRQQQTSPQGALQPNSHEHVAEDRPSPIPVKLAANIPTSSAGLRSPLGEALLIDSLATLSSIYINQPENSLSLWRGTVAQTWNRDQTARERLLPHPPASASPPCSVQGPPDSLGPGHSPPGIVMRDGALCAASANSTTRASVSKPLELPLLLDTVLVRLMETTETQAHETNAIVWLRSDDVHGLDANPIDGHYGDSSPGDDAMLIRSMDSTEFEAQETDGPKASCQRNNSDPSGASADWQAGPSATSVSYLGSHVAKTHPSKAIERLVALTEEITGRGVMIHRTFADSPCDDKSHINSQEPLLDVLWACASIRHAPHVLVQQISAERQASLVAASSQCSPAEGSLLSSLATKLGDPNFAIQFSPVLKLLAVAGAPLGYKKLLEGSVASLTNLTNMQESSRSGFEQPTTASPATLASSSINILGAVAAATSNDAHTSTSMNASVGIRIDTTSRNSTDTEASTGASTNLNTSPNTNTSASWTVGRGLKPILSSHLLPHLHTLSPGTLSQLAPQLSLLGLEEGGPEGVLHQLEKYRSSLSWYEHQGMQDDPQHRALLKVQRQRLHSLKSDWPELLSVWSLLKTSASDLQMLAALAEDHVHVPTSSSLLLALRSMRAMDASGRSKALVAAIAKEIEKRRHELDFLSSVEAVWALLRSDHPATAAVQQNAIETARANSVLPHVRPADVLSLLQASCEAAASAVSDISPATVEWAINAIAASVPQGSHMCRNGALHPAAKGSLVRLQTLQTTPKTPIGARSHEAGQHHPDCEESGSSSEHFLYGVPAPRPTPPRLSSSVDSLRTLSDAISVYYHNAAPRFIRTHPMSGAGRAHEAALGAAQKLLSGVEAVQKLQEAGGSRLAIDLIGVDRMRELVRGCALDDSMTLDLWLEHSPMHALSPPQLLAMSFDLSECLTNLAAYSHRMRDSRALSTTMPPGSTAARYGYPQCVHGVWDLAGTMSSGANSTSPADTACGAGAAGLDWPLRRTAVEAWDLYFSALVSLQPRLHQLPPGMLPDAARLYATAMAAASGTLGTSGQLGSNGGARRSGGGVGTTAGESSPHMLMQMYRKMLAIPPLVWEEASTKQLQQLRASSRHGATTPMQHLPAFAALNLSPASFDRLVEGTIALWLGELVALENSSLFGGGALGGGDVRGGLGLGSRQRPCAPIIAWRGSEWDKRTLQISNSAAAAVDSVLCVLRNSPQRHATRARDATLADIPDRVAAEERYMDQKSGQFRQQYSSQYMEQYSGQHREQYSGQHMDQKSGQYSGQNREQYSGLYMEQYMDSLETHLQPLLPELHLTALLSLLHSFASTIKHLELQHAQKQPSSCTNHGDRTSTSTSTSYHADDPNTNTNASISTQTDTSTEAVLSQQMLRHQKQHLSEFVGDTDWDMRTEASPPQPMWMIDSLARELGDRIRVAAQLGPARLGYEDKYVLEHILDTFLSLGYVDKYVLEHILDTFLSLGYVDKYVLESILDTFLSLGYEDKYVLGHILDTLLSLGYEDKYVLEHILDTLLSLGYVDKYVLESVSSALIHSSSPYTSFPYLVAVLERFAQFGYYGKLFHYTAMRLERDQGRGNRTQSYPAAYRSRPQYDIILQPDLCASLVHSFAMVGAPLPTLPLEATSSWAAPPMSHVLPERSLRLPSWQYMSWGQLKPLDTSALVKLICCGNLFGFGGVDMLLVAGSEVVCRLPGRKQAKCSAAQVAPLVDPVACRLPGRKQAKCSAAQVAPLVDSVLQQLQLTTVTRITLSASLPLCMQVVCRLPGREQANFSVAQVAPLIDTALQLLHPAIVTRPDMQLSSPNEATATDAFPGPDQDTHVAESRASTRGLVAESSPGTGGVAALIEGGGHSEGGSGLISKADLLRDEVLVDMVVRLVDVLGDRASELAVTDGVLLLWRVASVLALEGEESRSRSHSHSHSGSDSTQADHAHVAESGMEGGQSVPCSGKGSLRPTYLRLTDILITTLHQRITAVHELGTDAVAALRGVLPACQTLQHLFDSAHEGLDVDVHHPALRSKLQDLLSIVSVARTASPRDISQNLPQRIPGVHPVDFELPVIHPVANASDVAQPGIKLAASAEDAAWPDVNSAFDSGELPGPLAEAAKPSLISSYKLPFFNSELWSPSSPLASPPSPPDPDYPILPNHAPCHPPPLTLEASAIMCYTFMGRLADKDRDPAGVRAPAGSLPRVVGGPPGKGGGNSDHGEGQYVVHHPPWDRHVELLSARSRRGEDVVAIQVLEEWNEALPWKSFVFGGNAALAFGIDCHISQALRADITGYR
eukprot:gene31331-6478_t